MTAIETLIERYRKVNGFVASDGYEDRDEDEIVEAAISERLALIEELKLWKPMTNEEAEKAFDEAADIPISDEEINQLVERVTDPAYRPTEPEHVLLAAKVCQLSAQLSAVEQELIAARKRIAAIEEVASWSQATLTALNAGDVSSGSPLHLKLREVMIAFRDKTRPAEDDAN